MNGLIRLPSTSHTPGSLLTHVGNMGSSAHRQFPADRAMSGRFRASAKEAQSRKTARAGSGSEAVGREAIAACPDAVELLCCAPVL
jgi:hypothetical protein